MKKTYGMMITEYRKKKGMTQLELAQQLGVTDKAVSKWERDRSIPDVSLFPQLAEILGISADELLQMTPARTQSHSDFSALLSLICRAVALAAGVAVTVLTAMGTLEPRQGMGLLGIGLAALALSLLSAMDHES